MNAHPAVLYVDDDPQSCEIMELLLVGMMELANVTVFGDSQNFMERARQLTPPPDIVLLDIHMQPYSGFEALKMLRQDGQFARTPVIALTASVMNDEVQLLRQAGFNAVVPKPVSLRPSPTPSRAC